MFCVSGKQDSFYVIFKGLMQLISKSEEAFMNL